ncbi:phosphoprotein [Ohlsdorf virus]|uniref:Phosphoprotein n=1 Tax=Ohlsdorf virus TaxID=2040592 RepID=A0A291I324_9RHAB|nr:phosphoprotein [Ohlsdorf virus]ATG83559.1 phosphoprotein [Ohlsdorf virus]
MNHSAIFANSSVFEGTTMSNPEKKGEAGSANGKTPAKVTKLAEVTGTFVKTNKTMPDKPLDQTKLTKIVDQLGEGGQESGTTIEETKSGDKKSKSRVASAKTSNVVQSAPVTQPTAKKPPGEIPNTLQATDSSLKGMNLKRAKQHEQVDQLTQESEDNESGEGGSGSSTTVFTEQEVESRVLDDEDEMEVVNLGIDGLKIMQSRDRVTSRLVALDDRETDADVILRHVNIILAHLSDKPHAKATLFYVAQDQLVCEVTTSRPDPPKVYASDRQFAELRDPKTRLKPQQTIKEEKVEASVVPQDSPNPTPEPTAKELSELSKVVVMILPRKKTGASIRLTYVKQDIIHILNRPGNDSSHGIAILQENKQYTRYALACDYTKIRFEF